jgi:23S rRNA (adenine2030-N6)-methyltransferase
VRRLTECKTMYSHYGNIGDIWKHFPLTDVLALERPIRYVETNSSRAVHTMDSDWRRRLGIGHFLSSSALAAGHFGSHEKAAIAQGCYLGSPALAMKLLREHCRQYIFCDLDSSALDDVGQFALQLGIQDKVETVCADSRSCLRSRMGEWGGDTFVHIDPFNSFSADDSGHSYAGLFDDVASRGVKVFLWYGYNQRDLVGKWWTSRAAHVVGSARYEVEIEGYESLAPEANPGVSGCGIVVANLSGKILARVSQDHDEFCSHYRRVEVEGRIYRFVGRQMKHRASS